jgi:LysM repeat protein
VNDFAFGPKGALWLATSAGITIVSGGPYIVRAGDTLRDIATEFIMPLEELLATNPELATRQRQFGDLIFPGDVIDF